MLKRQFYRLQALERVLETCTLNPLENPGRGYTEAVEELRRAVAHVTGLGTAQIAEAASAAAAVKRKKELLRVLKVEHLLPLRKIAKAQLSHVTGLDAQFPRLPQATGHKVILMAARAIEQNAAQHQEMFIANDRPVDFMAQLAAAIGAVEQHILDRETSMGVRSAATRELPKAIIAARGIVNRIDAMLSSRYANDEYMKGVWRRARRIQMEPRTGREAVESFDDSDTGAAGPEGSPESVALVVAPPAAAELHGGGEADRDDAEQPYLES